MKLYTLLSPLKHLILFFNKYLFIKNIITFFITSVEKYQIYIPIKKYMLNSKYELFLNKCYYLFI